MLKETTILRVAPKASVEQGLEAALELALSQWQYHEELWVRNVKNAKSHVLAAIALVRHTPRNAFPEAVFPSPSGHAKCCNSLIICTF